jgi:hypothetical protein
MITVSKTQHKLQLIESWHGLSNRKRWKQSLKNYNQWYIWTSHSYEDYCLHDVVYCIHLQEKRFAKKQKSREQTSMGRLTYIMSADSKPYKSRKPLFYTEDQGSMFLHSVRSLGLSVLVSTIHRFCNYYYWNFMRLLLCIILLGCELNPLFFYFLNPATIGNTVPCSQDLVQFNSQWLTVVKWNN